MERRRFRTAALAIVLLAATLRFWALDAGLPHTLTRPDEEMLLGELGGPARGQWDLAWAVYPSAYVYLSWGWAAAGLEVGRQLGLVGTGDVFTTLRLRPERILLLERVLSALAGTATVALVMALARAALGPGAALAAGVLLATSFLHARDSHAFKPDALFALAVVAALGAMLPLARRGTVGRGAAAGAVIGLAMGIKYPAVILVAPLWVAAVMGSAARGWRRVLPASAIVGGAVAGTVFVATSPYLFINPHTRADMLRIFYVVFPQLGPVVPVPVVPPGTVDIPQTQHTWDGLAYHAAFSLRYGAGLLATLLAPCAVLWGLASRRPPAVLGAVFALVYYAVCGTSPALLARYMTPLVPVLALLEAGLLAALAARAGRCAGAVLALATALVAAEPLASAVAWDRLAARPDTRNLATAWLAEHAPRGALVAVAGTRFWPYGVPRMPPGVQARVVQDRAEEVLGSGAAYLLTHDHPLFSSRVDPALLGALAGRLEPLVDLDPFTSGGRTRAVFEPADAYYIPFHRFGAVERPGPHIRIYALRGGP